ncbi:NADH-quinone oxidoreductase subunit NuoI [Magnetofaba australis]|uniref:NADH-quinone oxidoreductase subunit I n=1 Tax=Magnetofaba australis IT-1 TaxID=1434232 RepID=A0A1Y2K7F1_9PROT|nr:NADH-quinone oxidoreductase subunit NuoI [Magnetofaba australis]OSM06224.1 putative NADH dehydrogenase subunit I [Magnetofaba australis IT-1]
MLGVKFKEILDSLFLKELVSGMAITLRYMFKPKITIQYPEERTPTSPRFRGVHVLRKYEDGEERCVACKLCEAICPAQAIYIEIDETSRAEKRLTKVYDIDLFKCIYCGLCEEACPVEAIVMGPYLDVAFENREDRFYHKDKMLTNGDKWKPVVDARLQADAKYR